MPDPKVQAAINEIEQVLRRHDLAGVAIVSSPSHTHYLHHIEATWSCCRMESPHGLRFRCKRADYPTEAEWKETMRISCGLVAGFEHALESSAQQLRRLLLALGKKVGIDHIDVDEGPTR